MENTDYRRRTSLANKNSWTLEKREYYSKLSSDRWANDEYKENMITHLINRYKNVDYLDKFKKKMNTINKNEEKRQTASKTLKRLWTEDEDYIQKMKSRAHKPKHIIEYTDKNNNSSIYEGFDEMVKSLNLHAKLVREFLNTDEMVTTNLIQKGGSYGSIISRRNYTRNRRIEMKFL